MHEFWDLTPRETYAVIRAAEWRMEQEQRGRAWLAWHTAALSRVKRMPALGRLLGGREAKELQGDELKRRRQEHEDLKRRMNVGH